MNHDIVAIGASAGGLQALKTVLSGLPEDLPASIFVTIHTSPESPGYLAEILGKVSPLRVVYASAREDIKQGVVYLARSNLHLIIKRGHIESRFLAKENGTRPAIDPMFRSAAHSYARRVIGVLLSGNLDDGAAGLGIIKDEGGLVVIQDPNDAQYNDMPLSALKAVEPDCVIPAAEMAGLLVDLVKTEAKGEPGMEERDATEGTQVLTCPGCGGVLRQYEDNHITWFQCQVGHRFTPETHVMEQNRVIEEHLWSVIALLKQKAETDTAMASDARSSPDSPVDHGYYKKQARAAKEAIETVEKLLQEKGDELFPGMPEKRPATRGKTRAREAPRP